MATDWMVYQWQTPWNYCAQVLKAVGYALVQWPSGRQTLEMYGGTAVMTAVEAANALYPERLKAQKEENLNRTMQDFQDRSLRSGYWIRQRRRRKARRIVNVLWVRPDLYLGPMPKHHSVL